MASAPVISQAAMMAGMFRYDCAAAGGPTQTLSSASLTCIASLSAVSQARGLASAVKSNEVALAANKRGYQVGMKINAEVLDAQQKLFEAQRDLSKARYDAWLNFIKLNAVTGRLDEMQVALLDAVLVSQVDAPPTETAPARDAASRAKNAPPRPAPAADAEMTP